MVAILLSDSMKEYLNQEVDTNDFDLVSVIDDLPLWSAPFGLELLDTIRLKPGVSAIDIGCGLGFPLIEISQRLGNTSKVFGIDPWEKATERIQLKIKKYNIKNVQVVRGLAEHLPFPDNFFDLIVSNNGINNVQDIELTLSECHRVSKPYAQFVLTLNLEKTMIEFYEVFEKTLLKDGLEDEVQKMKEQIYSKRKPLNETESLLESVGFQIKSTKNDSFKIRFSDGTSMLNHYLIRFWFTDGWKNILSSNDLERIFDQIEDELNIRAKKQGEFYLTIPFVTIDCRNEKFK